MKSRNKKVFITSLFSALSVCLVGGVAALNGSQAQEAYAAELEEYVLDAFTIEDYAQVRTAEPNGIRFTVTVPEDIKTQYSGYTFGTLLLPEDMLGDNELTFSTEMHLDIPASKWQDDYTYTSVLAGKEVSDGVFENLPESYYNRPIVARAYITNGTQVYYSSNTTTRSIGYVAKMNVLTGTSNSELLQTIANKTEIDFADSITLSTVAGSDILYNTIENVIDAPKLLVGGIAVDSDVQYSVSGDAVSLSDGNLRAVKTGTATVTATTSFYGVNCEKAVTVTVNDSVEFASDYSILVPAGTTSKFYADPVHYAAKEFQNLFKEATGVTLSIVEEDEVSAKTTDKYISIGATELSSNKVSVKSMKDTASAMAKVDNTVFLCGNTDEGTMYGVFEYLNDILGYEYYAKNTYTLADGVEVIEKLNAMDAAKEYVPSIEYSIAPSNDISSEDSLLNNYRMNSWYEDILTVNGAQIHNTFNILPPFDNMESSETAGNFKTHPKWYTSQSTWGFITSRTFTDEYGRACPYEICFNAQGDSAEYEEMLSTAIKAYTDVLATDKTTNRASLSIRDNVVWCACAACKAESATDAAIEFLNDVCEGIRAWMTDNNDPRVDTFRMIFLAYYTTGAAPTTQTTLDPYIDVWFAESFAVYTLPMNDSTAAGETATAWTNLQAWATLLNQSQNCTNGVRNNNLFVWTYNSNMYELLAPYNSFNSMRVNYGLFDNLGVNSVYNYTDSAMSGWSALKKYLASQLAWNANPTDDEWNGWIDNFFANAYGDGAMVMKSWFNNYLTYADTIADKFNVGHNVSTNPVTASIYQNVATYDMDGDGTIESTEINTAFFTKDILNTWLTYANNALNALDANDPNYQTYYNNIALERLSPLYLLLEIYSSELDDETIIDYAATFCGEAQSLGLTAVSLTESIDEAITKYSTNLQASVSVAVGVGETISSTAIFGDSETISSVKINGAEVYDNGALNITTGTGVYSAIVTGTNGTQKIVEIHYADKVIRTFDDFSAMKYTGTNISGYYVLDGDVNANGATISGASYGWSQNAGFQGTFDGRGYTVSNLTVGSYGIFGTLGMATVQNVNFENVILQAHSSLFAFTMYNSVIKNVNVTYAALDATMPDWRGAGLLVARQTATESKWTDVVLDATGLNIPIALGLQVEALTCSNVTIKSASVTAIGYSDNYTTVMTEWPDGVTWVETQVASTETVDTRVVAEQGTVTLTHAGFTVGDSVTVNGVAATVVTAGEVTVTIDGMEIGATTTLVCQDGLTTINYTNVINVTKAIATFDDLAAVKHTGTAISGGYYLVTKDIDGNGATISGATLAWSQNGGFCGGATFDGDGHTISNFTVNGYGIFGTLGHSYVKNVNFAGVTLSGSSSLLSGNMYNTHISDVSVTYTAVNSTAGLLQSVQLGQGSTWTNVTLDAGDNVVPNALGAKVNVSGTNKVTFTNVKIIAKSITKIGTGGAGSDVTEEITQWPSGVTATVAAIEETIATEVLTDASTAKFEHASLAAGEEVTMTVNGTAVTATAYDGYVTADFSAVELTAGKTYEAVITTADYVLTYTNVFYATQVIDDLSELSVVQALATDVQIYGYYVLGGDIDGNGATLASTVQIWNQNNGFRGTLDGRGHTISNFNTGNYGIFGNLAYGGEIKNITLNVNKSFSNVIAYAVRAAKITDVTVSVNAIQSATWYALADEINNSTVTNLTVTYAESVVVSGNSRVLCKSYGSTTFTNVTVTTSYQNAEMITSSGTPTGVTVNKIGSAPATEYTVETETYAEESGAVLAHEAIAEGDAVTATVNGVSVSATATAGSVTADLSGAGLTLGETYSVVVATETYAITYTNVMYVTKAITTVAEFNDNVRSNGGAIITGYYVLANDLSYGYVTQNSSGSWTSGAGFQGTFDGRGHKIDNLNMGWAQNGLFVHLGTGAVLKNFSITNITTRSGYNMSVLAHYALGGGAARIQISDVTLQFKEIIASATSQQDASSLLIGRTMQHISFTNVTIDASGLDIPQYLYVLSHEVQGTATFSKCVVKANSFSEVARGVTSFPTGITYTDTGDTITQVEETIETKLAADADTGLIVNNANIVSGDVITATVNGATTTATATEDGTVMVDVSAASLTAGTVYEIVLETATYKLTCTDVIYADKVIRSIADLAAVKYTGTNITGYFAVAGNLAATTWVDGAINAEHEISGASEAWNQNSGFQGTFDGRDYTISGLAITGHGIFGSLGKATVKNISFTGIQIGWGSDEGYVLAQNIYNTAITDVYIQVTGVYGGRGGATWVGVMCNNMQVYTRLTNVTIDVTGANLKWAIAYNAELSNVANSYTNVVVYTNDATKVIGDGGNATQSDPLPTGITVNPAE